MIKIVAGKVGKCPYPHSQNQTSNEDKGLFQLPSPLLFHIFKANVILKNVAKWRNFFPIQNRFNVYLCYMGGTNMENEVELAYRFAEMLQRSRKDAGKSQDYVAKALGVSKKTVQNWEDGISFPNQLICFQWFKVLGQQPLHYYLEWIYPEEFGNITSDDDDKRIEEALVAYIRGTSPSERRRLLFILFGDHGSSPDGVINMVTAHLHCELRSRLNIAQSIINNYEIAESHGTLIAGDHVMPNMNSLRKSFANAKEAVKRKENSYSNTD